MKIVGRLVALVLALIVGAGGYFTWNASKLVSRSVDAPPVDAAISAAPVSARRLAEAVRYRTVSMQDSLAWDPAPFREFHAWADTAFPRVAATLTREVVNGYSLLYTWKGSDSTLAPLLLTGHFDVVPVEPGTDTLWTHPPFAGDTASGFLWGRGSLDDKISVVGILEGAELLLASGFQPQRTVLLAFGHDEELGGYAGAAHLARLVEQRYGKVSMLVDEGGLVTQGVIPGVTRSVGLVGVAEKSSLTVELSVTAPGGHSSVPPQHSALGVLSRALTRLEDNQMPARMTSVTRTFLRNIASEGPFAMRMAMANPMLEGLVVQTLLRRPEAASTIRTSTAVTMASGSPKENVLPIRAVGLVNFRILPGDSVAGVLAHVRRVVNDTAVQIRALGHTREPSAVSDFESNEYRMLERTMAQLYPGVLPTPYLLTGATDTRHYESLTRNVYRFVPGVITPELLAGAHGTNERIGIATFTQGIRFWAQLMKNAQER